MLRGIIMIRTQLIPFNVGDVLELPLSLRHTFKVKKIYITKGNIYHMTVVINDTKIEGLYYGTINQLHTTFRIKR